MEGVGGFTLAFCAATLQADGVQLHGVLHQDHGPLLAVRHGALLGRVHPDEAPLWRRVRLCQLQHQLF